MLRVLITVLALGMLGTSMLGCRAEVDTTSSQVGAPR